MSQQHTPGPWRIDGNYIVADIDDGEESEVTVAQIGNVDTVHLPPPDGQDEANAALITTAPCLLAALEAILPEAEHAEQCEASAVDNISPRLASLRRRLALARAAIRKAKGETS